MFNEDQISQLQSLMFINKIDDHLKVVSGVEVIDHPPIQQVILKLDIFYDNDAITPMSFNLHNYNLGEIIDIAENIKSNEFILNEIDIILSSWGD